MADCYPLFLLGLNLPHSCSYLSATYSKLFCDSSGENTSCSHCNCTAAAEVRILKHLQLQVNETWHSTMIGLSQCFNAQVAVWLFWGSCSAQSNEGCCAFANLLSHFVLGLLEFKITVIAWPRPLLNLEQACRGCSETGQA